MGCDISRFSVCYWRTKPGRKRLSSGDSDFRHNPDWVEFVGKSDTREGNPNSGHQGWLVSLRKMFSRRKSKPSEPTLPGCSAPSAPSSSEESVETAVRSRNVDLLLKLIHQSGDGFVLLPATGVSKKTNPVELACSLGYYDMVEVLLENGCSPNLPTSAGKLLHSVLDSLKSHEQSIKSGRRVVNILINSGCDLDIKDRSGITPLMHCAQIGDGDIMQAVLDRCSSKQLTFQCSGSYTPLHMSSMRGDLACVRLLLSRSPHTHVNLKDNLGNTALHLALKSMLHNIPYLNAARESLVSCGNENSSQTAATCERLMRFQQNSVAIVEALLMAGAEVHVACWPLTHAAITGPQENFFPLVYALHLCALDHTQGFELDHNQFSPTINLVSRQTIQSLEGLGKAVSHSQAPVSEEHYRFSPYAGVVRLLVLAGTQVSEVMREILYRRFEILQFLLDEVCSFWDKYQVTKPPKLVHLSKLSVRSHLADIHRLHEINRLPVPPRIKEYLKLNCL